MSSTMVARAFDYLKEKSPGDELEVLVDGVKMKAFLIRRGRQNARVRLENDELVLVPLDQIVLSGSS